MCFDSHCPSQPFTRRVLLDQHIQLTHKDREGKNVKCDQTEASPDKKMVLWQVLEFEEFF